MVQVVPRDVSFKQQEERRRAAAKEGRRLLQIIHAEINKFEAGRGGRPDYATTEFTRQQLRELAASFDPGREAEGLEAVRRELVRLTGNQW
jgi:hypothetical protein